MLASRFFHSLFLYQQLFQILTGKGSFALRNLLRRAAAYHRTAAVTALRTQINDMIRSFYDIKVMFNDDDGIAAFCQTLDKLYHRSKAESKADFVHVARLLAERTGPQAEQPPESVSEHET